MSFLFSQVKSQDINDINNFYAQNVEENSEAASNKQKKTKKYDLNESSNSTCLINSINDSLEKVLSSSQSDDVRLIFDSLVKHERKNSEHVPENQQSHNKTKPRKRSLENMNADETNDNKVKRKKKKKHKEYLEGESENINVHVEDYHYNNESIEDVHRKKKHRHKNGLAGNVTGDVHVLGKIKKKYMDYLEEEGNSNDKYSKKKPKSVSNSDLDLDSVKSKREKKEARSNGKSDKKHKNEASGESDLKFVKEKHKNMEYENINVHVEDYNCNKYESIENCHRKKKDKHKNCIDEEGNSNEECSKKKYDDVVTGDIDVLRKRKKKYIDYPEEEGNSNDKYSKKKHKNVFSSDLDLDSVKSKREKKDASSSGKSDKKHKNEVSGEADLKFGKKIHKKTEYENINVQVEDYHCNKYESIENVYSKKKDKHKNCLDEEGNSNVECSKKMHDDVVTDDADVQRKEKKRFTDYIEEEGNSNDKYSKKKHKNMFTNDLDLEPVKSKREKKYSKNKNIASLKAYSTDRDSNLSDSELSCAIKDERKHAIKRKQRVSESKSNAKMNELVKSKSLDVDDMLEHYELNYDAVNTDADQLLPHKSIKKINRYVEDSLPASAITDDVLNTHSDESSSKKHKKKKKNRLFMEQDSAGKPEVRDKSYLQFQNGLMNLQHKLQSTQVFHTVDKEQFKSKKKHKKKHRENIKSEVESNSEVECNNLQFQNRAIKSSDGKLHSMQMNGAWPATDEHKEKSKKESRDKWRGPRNSEVADNNDVNEQISMSPIPSNTKRRGPLLNGHIPNVKYEQADKPTIYTDDTDTIQMEEVARKNKKQLPDYSDHEEPSSNTDNINRNKSYTLPELSDEYLMNYLKDQVRLLLKKSNYALNESPRRKLKFHINVNLSYQSPKKCAHEKSGINLSTETHLTNDTGKERGCCGISKVLFPAEPGTLMENMRDVQIDTTEGSMDQVKIINQINEIELSTFSNNFIETGLNKNAGMSCDENGSELHPTDVYVSSDGAERDVATEKLNLISEVEKSNCNEKLIVPETENSCMKVVLERLNLDTDSILLPNLSNYDYSVSDMVEIVSLVPDSLNDSSRLYASASEFVEITHETIFDEDTQILKPKRRFRRLTIASDSSSDDDMKIQSSWNNVNKNKHREMNNSNLDNAEEKPKPKFTNTTLSDLYTLLKQNATKDDDDDAPFPKELLHEALENALENSKCMAKEYQHLCELVIQTPWEIPIVHTIETRVSSAPTQEQRKHLEQLKVPLKLGPYTKEEDKRILDNFREFCQVHNLPHNPEPFLSLAFGGKPLLSRTERINFVRYLGKGLDFRLLYSIYKRFICLHSKTKKGRFTKDEDTIIEKFLTRYKYESNKFSMLAKILNRDRSAIEKRYKFMLAKQTTIAAKTSERLPEYLKSLMTILKVDDVSHLKDKEISTEVFRQLGSIIGLSYIRTKRLWDTFIYPRLFSDGPVDNNAMIKQLIRNLVASKKTDFRDIKWSEMATELGTNPAYLYYIFRCTMSHHVPKTEQHDLSSTLQHLARACDECDNLMGTSKLEISITQS